MFEAHLAVLLVLNSTRRTPRGMASPRITSAVMLLVAGTSTRSAGPAPAAPLQRRSLPLRVHGTTREAKKTLLWQPGVPLHRLEPTVGLLTAIRLAIGKPRSSEGSL